MVKYPLSKTEEGIYVSCLNKTDAYNLANVIDLGCDIDINKFISSVKKVFLAHPYLFTVLYEEDGIIYKRIEEIELKLDVIEASSLKIDTEYFELLNKHLFSLKLYKIDNNYFFYFNFHHIIFDGFSIHMFITDLFNAYDSKEIKKEEYDANMASLDEASLIGSDIYNKSHDFFINNIKDPELDSTIIYDKNDGEVKYKNINKKLNQ